MSHVGVLCRPRLCENGPRSLRSLSGGTLFLYRVKTDHGQTVGPAGHQNNRSVCVCVFVCVAGGGGGGGGDLCIRGFENSKIQN